MNRILCLGNRYLERDSAGPRIYDYMMRGARPAGVSVVDGGLPGLRLLSWLEGARCAVLVDSMQGLDTEMVELAVSEMASSPVFGHSGAVPYLLRVMPAVCEGPLPDITVLGVACSPSEDCIAQVARRALQLVGAEA